MTLSVEEEPIEELRILARIITKQARQSMPVPSKTFREGSTARLLLEIKKSHPTRTESPIVRVIVGHKRFIMPALLS